MLWNSPLVCRGASSGRDIRTLPASPTQGSGEGLVGSGGHGQKGKLHGQEAGGLQLLIPGFLPSQQHRLLLPVKSERGCLTFPRLQCSLLLIVQGDGRVKLCGGQQGFRNVCSNTAQGGLGEQGGASHR